MPYRTATVGGRYFRAYYALFTCLPLAGCYGSTTLLSPAFSWLLKGMAKGVRALEGDAAAAAASAWRCLLFLKQPLSPGTGRLAMERGVDASLPPVRCCSG